MGGCHLFKFDSLREQRSAPLTAQSGSACFKNSCGALVANSWFKRFLGQKLTFPIYLLTYSYSLNSLSTFIGYILCAMHCGIKKGSKIWPVCVSDLILNGHWIMFC